MLSMRLAISLSTTCGGVAVTINPTK